MPELTTAPVETAIDTADELYFNDVSETPDALNRITFGNFRGSVLSGVIDLGSATSFELPNSATPTVDADGEIAVDTSVADFSHGIVKVFAGEELALVALPIAELTTPTDGHVIAYNATNDEFELVAAASSGIGGSTGSTDNAILRADGTGGATAQNSAVTIDDSGNITVPSTAQVQVSTRNLISGNTGAFSVGIGSTSDWVDVNYGATTNHLFRIGSDLCFQIDGNATAGNTRLLVYDVDNATLERVSVGAADSGGSGYKVLRIPN